MQDFYLIVNWLVTLALLGLGLAALLKGGGLLLNRVFAIFTVTSGIWIMASYISNDVHNSPQASVIGNYLVFLFSYVTSYLLLWFTIALTRDRKAEQRLKKFLVPVSLIAITTCTPLIVAGVHRQGQVYAIDFGPFIVIYFISLLAALVMALVVLRVNIKRKTGNQKAHLVILYRALVIAIPVLLFTEFILPAITGWFGLTNVGLLIWLVPVFGIYYSVVRLRLFNLRLVIVRTLAYVLTLSILGTLYGIVSYELSKLIQGVNSALLQEALNVLLIVVAINVYPPMIKAFRRLTNGLFYQDAYDPQTLYDQLNTVLVSSIDIDYLMSESMTLLQQALRPEYALIGVKDGQGQERFFGGAHKGFTSTDIQKLRQLTPRLHQKVILTDYLDDDHQHAIKQFLLEHDVAVLVQLAQEAGNNLEGLGYIILGPRKSGNPYSVQDARALESMANELVIAIQNALHYEEVQNFNKTLQEQVDDATRKLQRTNEKLRQLDETKDEFISMASHQLRTPLTSVKGYLSMVLEGDVGKLNAQQTQMLTQSYASSQRMVYLISDLLNLSRLNTGKFVIEPVPVNLADVIEFEVNQLHEAALARDIKLIYDKPGEFPQLMLDETKIHQVVMNFLDNAIYYTRASGSVHIILRETPTAVEYLVKDNGIGVPKSEQHKLFAKFYRAPNAQKARPDGTGLGLFMAKKVIVAQGGSIIFESEEGKGSTFGFRFSKATHGVPTAPIVASTET